MLTRSTMFAVTGAHSEVIIKRDDDDPAIVIIKQDDDTIMIDKEMTSSLFTALELLLLEMKGEQ